MIPEVLEFMGVLLICATAMLTHNNPYFIGLAYTSAMLIAHQSIVHFNPLFVLLNFSLGRLTIYESLKLLVIQTTAVLAFIIAYKASKE
jgi:hypothetical protein